MPSVVSLYILVTEIDSCSCTTLNHQGNESILWFYIKKKAIYCLTILNTTNNPRQKE